MALPLALPLLKIPLLLAAAAAQHTALTPPTPPPAPEETVTPTGAETVVARAVAFVPATAKYLFWIENVCECAVLLAVRAPTHPLAPATLRLLTGSALPSAAARAVGLSPPYLLGLALLLSGTALRLASYRALGRHFTFTLSLKHNHALVTGGPYARVRHPAYAGLALVLAGSVLCFAGPGAWLAECVAPRVQSVRVVMGVWAALHVGLFVAALPRVGKEDRMLRETFGSEWDQWAARTPWRLVPGVW